MLSLLPLGCATGSAQRPASSGDAEDLALQIAPATLRSDEVTLIWNKAASAPADISYRLFLNGEPVAQTAKTHFTFKGLAPAHDYIFDVLASPTPDTASAGAAASSNRLRVRTREPEPVVSALDYGAVGDGKTLNTRALQSAIDACPPHGVVRIPAGVFLSGALFLKSDMTLEVAKGGVLQGTANPSDYLPRILNRFEGWEMETHASLLNAGRLDRSGPANIRNLSIRGEGVISGGGRKLSDRVKALHPTPVAGFRDRGRLIVLMNAENVEIAGLTLKNPPCWTLHYIYSENVTLRGLTIRSDVHNGDGIDPDSSKNSYIFGCTFDTGDDCIAIKSGKNPEGNVVNRPTENVRVFDCRFDRGHGISIGSEMSGGVRGVLIEDCVAGPLLHGLQIKATPARGGFVEDVTVRNCDLRQITIYTELPYNNDGAAAPAQPFFRDFRFLDLDLSKADTSKPVIVVNGFSAEGHRTKNLRFENLKLPAASVITVDRAEDAEFKNVLTTERKAPEYRISRSEDVRR